MIEKFSEDIEGRLKEIFSNPDIINKFKKSDKMTTPERLSAILHLIIPLIHNKDKLVTLLEMIPELIIYLDILLMDELVINEEFYIESSILLERASDTDEIKTINIIDSFFQSFDGKYPFEKFTETIQLIHDFPHELVGLIKSTQSEEVGDKFSAKLFEMIEQNQRGKFDYYLFDWILKFGYLIECYYKEVLIVIFKLSKLLSNKSFENIPKSRLTVGRILYKLKIDSTLGLIRNAIFHSDFTIDYRVNIDNREIIFKDRKGSEEKLYLIDFFDIFIQIIQTIRSASFSFNFFLSRKRIEQFVQEFGSYVQQLKDVNQDAFKNISYDNLVKQIRNKLEELLDNMIVKQRDIYE